MDSVGELLRGERLRQGLELTDVADRTRIHLGYLEAIEAGDAGSLPGAFFYRAFVRQYARLLGLDESRLEPALSVLREQAEAAQPLPHLQPAPPAYDVPPVPTPGARKFSSGPKVSSLLLLVAVIVACGGLYALWQSTRRVEPVAPPPPPARVEARTPEPQPPQQQPVVAPPAAELSPAPEPGRSATPGPVQPATPEAAKPPAPEPVKPPAQAPAAIDAKLAIEVVASDTVWLSATMDGKKTVSVLNEGQTRRFTANERASLFLGNAGGVDIRVNGKPLGPVGPRGQLRTVVITPEGFTITNPREKKEPPAAPVEP